jgi:tetratricopeptide (TPR) repeat protein
VPRPAQSPAPSAAALARELPPGWFFAGVLLLLLAAYGPALSGTLLWDDAGHVTRADLRPLSGLGRIWFEVGATQQYYPVLHTAFWLEHRLWGDATLGYHVLNVALHALAATQFLVVLRRLAVPGATLAALLFALHPVCVESVAWIAEQKNTLSLVFYLAAALAYLRFDAERHWRRYALALFLFILGLMTKTVTATLPAALLVVFWWRRGRLDGWRDVLPLLPWFALGATGGLFTAHLEKIQIGAEGADFALGFMDRCVLAGKVFWFYLGSLAWPFDLLFVYPRWAIDATAPLQWGCLLAAAALFGLLLFRARRQRGPLAAGLLFAGSLFPVLGFFNVYPFVFSYVADHFQYLASLALFAPAGAGLKLATAKLPRAAATGLAALLLAGLGTLTWRQSRMYRDVFALWETTLAHNPGAWMAHHNLALALGAAGRVEEALPHLETVLRLHPDHAPAENNLGNLLIRLGRIPEALPHLERALQLHPAYPEAHNNLGSAYLSLERLPESRAHFEQALQLNPDYAVAHRNLGVVLAMSSRFPEAIDHFAAAARLDPDYADAEINWAVTLMLTQGLPDAVPHFERAVAIDPASVDARLTYGRALLEHGRYDEAIAQFEAILRLHPNQADAHMNLALAFRQLGRKEEAIRHYTEALRLNPALGRQP